MKKIVLIVGAVALALAAEALLFPDPEQQTFENKREKTETIGQKVPTPSPRARSSELKQPPRRPLPRRKKTTPRDAQTVVEQPQNQAQSRQQLLTRVRQRTVTRARERVVALTKKVENGHAFLALARQEGSLSPDEVRDLEEQLRQAEAELETARRQAAAPDHRGN